jgi:CRP-like cAMP-binding protein
MTVQESLLESHPFFEGMAPLHINLIAQYALPAEFQAGQLLIRRSDQANQFYIILDGKVGLEMSASNRNVVPLMTLGAGEVLGWSWLLEPYVWHIDARAMESTRAISLNGEQLRATCEANPELGYQVLKRLIASIADRLMTTRIQMLDIYSVYREGGRL